MRAPCPVLREYRLPFRSAGRDLLRLLALIAALSGLAGPASANGGLKTYWRETYAGADITSNVWLLYSGVTLAPFSHIHGDGVRLRAAGGYGQYRYEGSRLVARNPKAPALETHKFRGTVAFVDFMVGYQARIGELTAKAFAGISGIDHQVWALDADVLARDPQNPAYDLEIGFKAALELWLNLGPDAWASADANWTTAHQSYNGRLRLGYRVVPTVSVGLEAGLMGNFLHRDEPAAPPLDFRRRLMSPQSRLGLFARYEWSSGEISLSGGVATDAFDFAQTDRFDNLYATVNWLTRF